jgi:hypothetical protein
MIHHRGSCATSNASDSSEEAAGCPGCCLFAELLVSHGFDALGAPDQVVDEGAKQRDEEDDEDPDQFVVPFGWLVRGAVGEHPQPEDGRGKGYEHRGSGKR